MDYQLADRLVANALLCGRDCFPLAGIDVAFRAFAFDFPRSIGRKYMDGSRCHTRVFITRPPASKPGGIGSCDSCREIPFSPGSIRGWAGFSRQVSADKRYALDRENVSSRLAWEPLSLQ
jgi:hypothetical protein